MHHGLHNPKGDKASFFERVKNQINIYKFNPFIIPTIFSGG